jgi:AraC family L-rhamnose operon transcriptional activator RhaR
VAGLILRKEEFFLPPQAVAVADRYPQNVFAEHTHEFCELVLVWRATGCTSLTIALAHYPRRSVLYSRRR